MLVLECNLCKRFVVTKLFAHNQKGFSMLLVSSVLAALSVTARSLPANSSPSGCWHTRKSSGLPLVRNPRFPESRDSRMPLRYTLTDE